jgi:hypothetical protein
MNLPGTFLRARVVEPKKMSTAGTFRISSEVTVQRGLRRGQPQIGLRMNYIESSWLVPLR